MPFATQSNITITGRGSVSINLHIPDTAIPEDVQYGIVDVQIRFSDGSLKVVTYDLLDRLTDDAPGLTHLANLVLLRDYILARIASEVLP